MNSMTGFGRGSHLSSEWQATIEIASVNRKQAEVVVQAPRELAVLEPRIRKQVLAAVSRGRLQISITLERPDGSGSDFSIDRTKILGFAAAFRQIEECVGYPVRPAAADFLRQPGLLAAGAGEVDPESAWTAIEPALADALAGLVAMRRREGDDLKADFLTRLETLAGYARTIAADAPGRPLRQRELLAKRLREAGLELDPNDERVVREIALFADRCDVSEELTRLDSHFTKFREYLEAAEPPGRALDFLCQELFREFNTIGSKANDAGIAQTIVEAKTELEKIREQVQNVE